MRTSIALIAALSFAAFVQAEKSKTPPPLEIVVFSSGWTDEKARATPEKPIYYVPMSGGYYSEGPRTGGDNSEAVKMEQVWVPLQRILAKQGYLPATKETPKPTQLVVFHWGVMSPDVLDAAFLNNKNSRCSIRRCRKPSCLCSTRARRFSAATPARRRKSVGTAQRSKWATQPWCAIRHLRRRRQDRRRLRRPKRSSPHWGFTIRLSGRFRGVSALPST
jgi:hypothetical protein